MSLLAREGEDWRVWTDWYDAWLTGAPWLPQLSARAREELEVAICLIPDADWKKGPAHVNGIIQRMVDEAVGPSERAATRFQVDDGVVDYTPSRETPAERERRFHAEALTAARKLNDSFVQSAQSDIVAATRNVLDVLEGETWAEPDVLRFASRPILSRALAYQHREAKWETTAEQTALLFDLNIVLRELQTFVAKQIRTHEADIDALALQLGDEQVIVEKLDAAAEAIVASVEVTTDRVADIFDSARAASEVRMEESEKSRLTAERVLQIENLIIAIGREIDVSAGEPKTDGPSPRKRPARKRSAPLSRKAREQNETASWEKFKRDLLARLSEKAGKAAADALIKVMEKQIARAPRTLGELAAVLLILVSSGFWPASTAAVALWLGAKVERLIQRGDHHDD